MLDGYEEEPTEKERRDSFYFGLKVIAGIVILGIIFWAAHVLF